MLPGEAGWSRSSIEKRSSEGGCGKGTISANDRKVLDKESGAAKKKGGRHGNIPPER